MDRVVTTELRVGWGDCDPAGIVYYPVFFRWFDVATFALFAAAGLPILELQRRYGTLGLPLLEAGARFDAPARPQDLLRIESRIAAVGEKTVELRHAVFRDETRLLDGRELRVWAVADPARPKGMRAEPIPPEVAARLGRPPQ
ncbi:MAG TPA: thioesterase family protein [Stellaceae bacterium]|nr:thioesterase family protein [Stellaceae bacterium]